jgi:hypothetical protein
MNFDAILAYSDADRAQRAWAVLQGHGFGRLVLTSGLAIQLHGIAHGLAAEPRPLNDIDFLVDSFPEIPSTLSPELLFRHVHPHDPPGKTLLQSVHPETAARIDIFRAYGGTTARAMPIELGGVAIRMVSLEDLAARTARLVMGLATDEQVPAKHARDLLRLLDLLEIGRTDAQQVNSAWQEHRKPGYPATFAEAAQLLTGLIATRVDLQIVPVYSRDTTARCSRCESTAEFKLADGGRVLSLLGYC